MVHVHACVLTAVYLSSCSILSARELRTLMTQVEDLPITVDSIDRFQWLLGNCSLNYTGITPQPSPEEFKTLYDPSFVSSVMLAWQLQ